MLFDLSLKKMASRTQIVAPASRFCLLHQGQMFVYSFDIYSVFSRNAGLGIEGRVSDLARLRWQCPSVPPFVSASVARCQPPTHLTSPHPTQTLKSFDFILTKIRSSHVKYNKKIFNTFTRIKISLFAIKFFVPILGFLNKSEVPERQNGPQKLKHSGYFFLFSYF